MRSCAGSRNLKPRPPTKGLVGLARNILAKEIFAARLGFEVEKEAVSAVVRARADFAIGSEARASDSTVYVGFQLDPRDLESQRR